MDFIEYFKKNWSILAAAALFIVGLLSTFLNPPPPYVVNDGTFSNWGKFVATLVIGLVLVAVILFASKAYTSRWWLTGFAMLILSAASFFAYQHFHQKWTCACFSDRDFVLIGTDLLNPDLEWVEKNKNQCKRLLQGGSCSADKVWTKDSIDRNRLLLAGLYTVSLPLLITAMMAVVQALFCAQKKEPELPTPPSPGETNEPPNEEPTPDEGSR